MRIQLDIDLVDDFAINPHAPLHMFFSSLSLSFLTFRETFVTWSIFAKFAVNIC